MPPAPPLPGPSVPATPPKLAIGAVVGAAFGCVFRNWKAYGRAAFIPFVVGIAVTVVTALLGLKLDPQKPTVPDLLGFVAGGIVVLAATMTFYTKACRIVLGPGQGDAPLGWIWQQAEWRCLGYFLLLSLAVGFASGTIGAVMFIAAGRVGGLFFAFWGVLGVLALISRFLFVFPAVSAGHPTGLGIAWQQSRGNAWRLIGLYTLFTLIMIGVQIPLLLVSFLALHLAGEAMFVQLTISFVGRALSLGLYAIFLSGLAIAYAQLTGYPAYVPSKPEPSA
ncbi:MAG: hypothetical protein AB7G15_12290 [Alphaproteobacteria bacterium]